MTLIERVTATLFVFGNAISNWFLSMDSARYPKNFSIKKGAESIYQLLLGYNTRLNSISLPNANSQFLQYTFKSNPEFASGIPSKNGSLELSLSFGSATPPAIVATIIEYDAMLMISQNSALLLTDV